MGGVSPQTRAFSELMSRVVAECKGKVAEQLLNQRDILYIDIIIFIIHRPKDSMLLKYISCIY